MKVTAVLTVRIFSAYQDTNKGISGISVVSSGHIFAQNGRCDYLLFYLAKGKELFYLNIETIADAGSFIFFGPFEKQEHIYTEKESASQGRYFDAISFVIQKMNKGYQNNYTLDEYAKMNKQNAHLYPV